MSTTLWDVSRHTALRTFPEERYQDFPNTFADKLQDRMAWDDLGGAGADMPQRYQAGANWSDLGADNVRTGLPPVQAKEESSNSWLIWVLGGAALYLLWKNEEKKEQKGTGYTPRSYWEE